MGNSVYGFHTTVKDGWLYCPQHERLLKASKCRTACRFYHGRQVSMEAVGINPAKKRVAGTPEEITRSVTFVCNWPMPEGATPFREHYERMQNFICAQDEREPLFPERETPE